MSAHHHCCGGCGRACWHHDVGVRAQPSSLVGGDLRGRHGFPAFLQAEAERAVIVRRIKQLLGTVDKRWSAEVAGASKP